MVDINTLPKTFLGANSASGFCSFFKESYYPRDGWRAYIIKGGPGTGKSSMMKQLAAYFADMGADVELCPCSSDPDSLDGVIIHDKQVVIMDGTSPHTVDPAYPGACEKILNLSDCWDDGVFLGKEREIIDKTLENKQRHTRASRYIGAAASLISDNRKIADEYINRPKLCSYAERLADRTLTGCKCGQERLRFLSGITPKGVLFFQNTVCKLCDTVIAVSDDYGAVSSLFMETILNVARDHKYEFYNCRNALHPELCDHLLFPSIGLAFCSENPLCHPEGITRRIHARRFTDMVGLSSRRSRMRFNSSAAEELLREAVSVIAEAKALHDELESYYIGAMDFSLVGNITERVAKEIEKR